MIVFAGSSCFITQKFSWSIPGPFITHYSQIIHPNYPIFDLVAILAHFVPITFDLKVEGSNVSNDTLLQRTTIFLTYLLLFFSFFGQGCTIVSKNFPFYLKCLDIFKNCFYPKCGNLFNWFSSCVVVLR